MESHSRYSKRALSQNGRVPKAGFSNHLAVLLSVFLVFLPVNALSISVLDFLSNLDVDHVDRGSGFIQQVADPTMADLGLAGQGIAQIFQTGEDNDATINQPGEQSFAFIQQDDTGTVADLNNVALVDQVSLSNGVDDAILLFQIGDGNEGILKTYGSGNRILAKQVGEENIAYINQGNADEVLEADENFALLIQNGNGNYANIYQLQSQNQARVSQVGIGNAALVLQDGISNVAEIVQNENGNNAYINQSGVVIEGEVNEEGDPHRNTTGKGHNGGSPGLGHLGDTGGGTLVLPSDFNLAYITQTGMDNWAGIDQAGTFNEATIIQDGDGNTAEIDQTGGFLETDTDPHRNQTGRGHIFAIGNGHHQIETVLLGSHLNQGFIKQIGGPDNVAGIFQAGENNFADIFQNGVNNEATVNQFGNDNIANLSQVGDGNFVELNQLNDGNSVSINQNGNNQSITLTQGGGVSGGIINMP